jgi:hypothetical protein
MIPPRVPLPGFQNRQYNHNYRPSHPIQLGDDLLSQKAEGAAAAVVADDDDDDDDALSGSLSVMMLWLLL